MKYSIIVPVYNAKKYLEEAVKSILAQETSSPFEVILVDDGSEDGSALLCDDLAKQDGRIQVLHQRNSGVSGARNTGIDAATGKYILFMDSDDLWEPELLAMLDQMLVNEPEIGTFNYRVKDVDGTITSGGFQTLPCGQSGKQWLYELFNEYALPRPYVVLYVYCRSFILKNRLQFDTELKVSEDYKFLMQAIPLATKIEGTDKELYVYVKHKESLSSKITKAKAMDFLSCKADIFRRFPTGAAANDYGWIVLRTGYWGVTGEPEVLSCLKKNRDILSSVTIPVLKFAHLLIISLGFKRGIDTFWKLAKIKEKLRGGAGSKNT